MILLSRLIKSSWTAPDEQENKKVISIRRFNEENEEEADEIVESIDHSMEHERASLIIQQAQDKAETILTGAKIHAETEEARLKEDKQKWEQERIRLTSQAREDGYEQGLNEGRAQGYQEMQDIIAEAKQIVDSSKHDYRKKVESSEQMILHIGLKVAEKILGERMEENNEYFLSVVRRALKEAREYDEVRLLVHPSNYEFLLTQKAELERIFPKETEFYIYPDSELPQQGCVIESENGRIDASVDQQLGEIKRKLFEMLESE